jgi:hypothetical protein
MCGNSGEVAARPFARNFKGVLEFKPFYGIDTMVLLEWLHSAAELTVATAAGIVSIVALYPIYLAALTVKAGIRAFNRCWGTAAPVGIAYRNPDGKG